MRTTAVRTLSNTHIKEHFPIDVQLRPQFLAHIT